MHNTNYTILDDDKKNYIEIKARITKIKETYPYRPIWSMIETNPITTHSIDHLISDGWTIEWAGFSGVPPGDGRVIKLERGIKNFERDRDLFHEIIHVWAGEELSDLFGSIHEYDDRTIIEWLARQLRSDPNMLRHTILAFGLEPNIYDRTSYEAFCNNPSTLDSQLFFPFAKNYFDKFKKIQME